MLLNALWFGPRLFLCQRNNVCVTWIAKLCYLFSWGYTSLDPESRAPLEYKLLTLAFSRSSMERERPVSFQRGRFYWNQCVCVYTCVCTCVCLGSQCFFSSNTVKLPVPSELCCENFWWWFQSACHLYRYQLALQTVLSDFDAPACPSQKNLNNSQPCEHFPLNSGVEMLNIWIILSISVSVWKISTVPHNGI